MRLGNARTIADIGYVIDGPSIGSDIIKWNVFEVDCSINRHRFTGDSYSFAFEVLHVSHRSRTKLTWQIAIISESWQFKKVRGMPRTTKSLKLIAGRSSDVLGWLRRSRDIKLSTASPRIIDEGLRHTDCSGQANLEKQK
jgi:hypothetical protein